MEITGGYESAETSFAQRAEGSCARRPKESAGTCALPMLHGKNLRDAMLAGGVITGLLLLLTPNGGKKNAKMMAQMRSPLDAMAVCAVQMLVPYQLILPCGEKQRLG